MNDTMFHGKTMVMSGGSRGIGFAIAEAFALRGGNVVLLAKTDQPHP
ncbi:NAD(P)-dependent dehydrogenase (short-subunit alcohol dehydrogenase family) [Nocardia sp. GAS34]